MDSIIKGYGLANFDDFPITGFLVPTGHYAQEIGLIDLFKEHLKINIYGRYGLACIGMGRIRYCWS